MNHFNQISKYFIPDMLLAITDEKRYSSINILKHLIGILGEKEFNVTFNTYFIENTGSFDERFYDFHKMMRQTDFYDTHNGQLDMIFWNFIQISDIPYEIFKKYYESIETLMEYNSNIGKQVTKCSIGTQKESRKPFKSGLMINRVKDVVMHDILQIPAYTFEEDDSQVECRRCRLV